MVISGSQESKEKTAIKSLAKYAGPIPRNPPPDILPVKDDVFSVKSYGPWSLENAPRIAIGLLVEGEQPGPRLYEVADYLLTFCDGGCTYRGFPDSLLLNGASLALIGYLCEGHHPEAELWRVSGAARLATVGHWRKAAVSDFMLTDCVRSVLAVAREKQMPVYADLLSLQERFSGVFVDQSRNERLQVLAGEYANHLIDPSQAEKMGKRLRDRAWQYDFKMPQEIPPCLREANETCDNLITLRAHMNVRYQFAGEIDWNLRLFDDKETTVSLAAHHSLDNLVTAYADTGQEKYAFHTVRLLESFYRLAPPPNYMHADGPWRTLEAGRRQAFKWPRIIALAGKSDSFTPEIHQMLAYSRLDHMRFATAFCGLFNNWYQVEAAGLATAALFSPELRQAEAYFRVAMRRLRWINSFAFLDDGHLFELNHGTQSFTVLTFLSLAEAARVRGIRLPQDFLDTLCKAVNIYVYEAMPNHHQPTFGDTRSFNVDVSEQLAAGAKIFNRQDFLWGAAHGTEGIEPEHCSCAWPSAGYYLMRDKWGKDGQYLFFDGGPYGANHQHEDKLNFCLYACNRQLIADPGICGFSATELTHYFKSARAHNTILIDGREQVRRLFREDKLKHIGRNEWISTPGFDFVSSEYLEGFARNPFGETVSANEVDKSISHRRAIFYVKSEYWILCDLIQGGDDKAHTLEQLFQIAPLHTPDDETPYIAGQVEATDKAVMTINAGVGNIAILPPADTPAEISLHKGELQPASGWWGMTGEYPAWTVNIKTETPLPARMDAVLYPLAPDRKDYPSVERLLSDAGSGALRVTGCGLDDTFILCEEGTGMVTVGDIRFEGRALLVRRQPELKVYAVSPVSVIIGGETITPET
jgi:hypothetical protein